MRQTQRVVDRGVEAWRQHLPAAHSAILYALATGARTLTPTAGLPSVEENALLDFGFVHVILKQYSIVLIL